MSREELIELRPLIPSALVDDTKELEHFQNEVLRPIIKYQHTFIKLYFEANEQFQEIIKNKKSRLEFQNRVKHFIGNQSNIKHQLIGSILGLLTEKELEFYWKNTSDLNKRIHQMVCQRVSDTFY